MARTMNLWRKHQRARTFTVLTIRDRGRESGLARRPGAPVNVYRTMSDSTPLITGVDFVCIPAQDFEAMTAFYGETLGLPFVKRYGSRDGAEYQAGNLRLAIMRTEDFGGTFSRNAMPIALQGADVAAARERLEGGGGGRGRGGALRQRYVRLGSVLAGDLPGPRRQPALAAPPLRAEGGRLCRVGHGSSRPGIGSPPG